MNKLKKWINQILEITERIFLMKPELISCKECMFCLGELPEIEWGGLCRRKPPTTDEQGDAVWPRVEDGDSCGEGIRRQ